MPIYVEHDLPAIAQLADEGFTIYDLSHKPADDLVIGVLNLMPLKIPTEADILRAFSSAEVDIEFRFFTTATHRSRNTSQEHIHRFYTYLDAATITQLDGLLITGAPVELIPYHDVDYYDEFCQIVNITNKLHKPVLLLCWAAFAGLYRRYGIDRTILDKKISGVYPHHIMLPDHPLMHRLPTDVIYAPQSRFVTAPTAIAEATDGLEVIAASDHAGVHIAATPSCMEVFITGHGEYSVDTLSTEYYRDLKKGINPSVPENYFVDDTPGNPILNLWQDTGRQIFSNWVSEIVVPRKPATEDRSEG